MPFTPLPTSLETDLRAAAGRPVLDLGAGDGVLFAHVDVPELNVVALDRERPPLARPHVVGDALRPPFRPGAVAVAVAANLLRHLPDRAGAIARWRGLLAPGGVLWILEDEPDVDDGPGALYRDLHRVLARLAPGRGADLLARDAFLATLDDRRGWSSEVVRNRERPRDVAPLIAGLEAAGERGLAARIRTEELDYGHYWWARWSSGRSNGASS